VASLSRRVVSGIICSQSRKISSCRVRHVVMAYLLPDVPLVPALVDIVFHAHSLLIGLLLVQTQFLVQSAVSVIITYRCTTPVLIVSCRFSVCTSLPMASRDRNARGTSTFHVFRCGAHGKWPLPPHLQPFWSCSQLCIFVAVAGALAFAATSLFVDRVFLRALVAIMTMEPALYSSWTESSSGKPNIHSNMFDQIPIASMSPPSAPSDDDVSYSSSSAEKTWDEPSALFHLDFSSHEPTSENMESALFAPPFDEPPTPFVQDRVAGTPHGSINPQVLMPKIKDEPDDEESKALELTLKLQKSDSSHTSTSFTAFTPMRLDASDTSSVDIKPIISSARLKSPSPDLDQENLRPSPEEYSRLSSKEKRQLRNKISARNFRNRRKEYITLLEEKLHERDSMIKQLQHQLSSLRLENGALHEELKVQRSRPVSTVDVSKLINALQRNAHSPSSRASSPDALDGARPSCSSPSNFALSNKDTHVSSGRPDSPSNGACWNRLAHMAMVA